RPWLGSFDQPDASSGRSRVDELKSSGKPFGISKWEVWEAWEKVKANKGAPGVDDRSIEDFGADLKRNLYRICQPDVVGLLLSAAGAGGGDTQAAWQGDQGAGGAHRRRQRRPNGGSPQAGGGGRADLPPRPLRLPAGPVGPGRGGGMPAALLADRLGDRPRHPAGSSTACPGT